MKTLNQTPKSELPEMKIKVVIVKRFGRNYAQAKRLLLNKKWKHFFGYEDCIDFGVKGNPVRSDEEIIKILADKVNKILVLPETECIFTEGHFKMVW